MSYLTELVKKRINTDPQQNKWEINCLVDLLFRMKPKNILEIGTAEGGTLEIWHKVAQPDGLIVSIDLPGGEFGGGYGRWRNPIYESFKNGNQRQLLLRADSHEEETLKLVIKELGSEHFDLLFIDGDHTFTGCVKDFYMYYQLVKKGGIVAFHDIAPDNPNERCQVAEAWKNIKLTRNTTEFIDKDSTMGIGVVYL